MQTKSKKPKGFRVRVGPKFKTLVNTLFESNIDLHSKAYANLANRLIKSNGPKWACARLKNYYNVGIHIALGINVPVIEFCKTKNNIPIDMLPFLPSLTTSNVGEKRAVLTVLRLFQTIHCEVDESTKTIEDPSPAEELFTDYAAFFDSITLKYKSFLKPQLSDEGLFTTARRGPNGPGMLEVDKDFVAVLESGLINTINEINEEITVLCKPRKGREVKVAEAFAPEYDNFMNPKHEMSRAPRFIRKFEMYQSMEKYIAWRESREPGCYDNCLTSKIGFISEGGCKTRIFAIGDWFTQDALKPIHKEIYRMLSQLETDGTSSHNRISELVRERTSKASAVWSYDLTAFTDRFPVFIQERVLSLLFTPRLGSLWRKLITDRDFDCKGRKVRYRCGQPMGLLSSWAVAALTHHITVEACALKVGISSFKDYVLIGDDVTIFNGKVAEEYERFLDRMSISISKAKSLRSDGKPSSAEIAKRIFRDGVELSPIPPDAIESAIKDYLLFPNLIKLSIERGINISQLNTPVQSILPSVYPKGDKAGKVVTILSYPLRTPPLGVTSDQWDGFDLQQVEMKMIRIRYEYISSKVKDMYNRDLLLLPDMGSLGIALQSNTAPQGIDLHPLLVVLRNYRDRCGSIYQKVAARRVLPTDLENLPFLVSPLIPQYVRRSHRVERVNSTLILKTYQALINPA